MSLDKGDSVLLLYDVEFNVDTPNTPTQFCTARSTNATESLVDDAGRRFSDVFPKSVESKEIIPPSPSPASSPHEDNFKDSCIKRIIKATGKELIKKSVSTYLSKDGKSGYVLRTSKKYVQGTREKYWYAYKRIKDISNCKNQFYVFGCNDENTIVILPVTEIEARIDSLNFSKDGNGNPSYWHIVFFKDESG